MTDNLSLHGKHAVVTGASRGIGAAIARELAEQGARVSLMSRDADALKTVKRTLANADIHQVFAIDVTQADQIESVFSQCESSVAPIDILVNNAGAAASAPFSRTDSALMESMFAVNFTSVFHCSQHVLAGMYRQRGGRIINIASTAGLKGYSYVSAYCAAKHAVVGLTRSLAMETAEHGITVNAVCPGFTQTDLLDKAIDNIVGQTGQSRSDAQALLLADTPQKRFVQPEEVANAVAWLCAPGSAAVTGECINVAGGEVT